MFGPMEVLILLFGGPLIGVVLLIVLLRRNRRLSSLEAEVRRLRDECKRT